METPNVSVIVPVYNAGNYLEQCIDSVLCQTYSDFEILLVDDGSTDGSGEICDRYGRQDRRVRVFHKPNGGSSAARNLALSEARGSYIIFLDSDDYWYVDDCLETLLNVALRENADIVRGEYKAVDESGIDLFEREFSKKKKELSYKTISAAEFLMDIMRGEYFLPLSLIRIKLMKTTKFDESLIYLEDMDLYSRLLMQTVTCVFIPCRFYAYRKVPTSVSSNISIKALGDSFSMCRHFDRYASVVQDIKVKQYYRWQSVMMYYWTLQTVADFFYEERAEIVKRLELDLLVEDVRTWLHTYHVHAFSLVFYLPAWLGIIYISYRDRLKDTAYRLLAHVKKLVKS